MFMEIDEGFLEHPKTLQLCATMGNPLAFGYLLHFWRWACRSCKDGDLTGLSEYVIEEAAKYHQHDGKLFNAMSVKLGGKAGFIDVDDMGNPVRIHNWDKRTGGAISRMDAKVKANKDRREAARLKHEGRTDAGTMPESVPPQFWHNAGQSRQDQSSPDKTSQGDLPARDPGTTDTDVQVQPDPLDDGPLLPTTPSRLKSCLDAAMQKTRPERCPYSAGQWWDREAGQLLRDLGDPAAVAPEIIRRIGLFVADDRMAPWTVKRFCAEYNGIGVARPSQFEKPKPPQASWGKPVTMADVEAAKARSTR